MCRPLALRGRGRDGNMGYRESRLRQAILYMAWLTRDDEKFGSTKLNKALFRADFHSYFQRGVSVTNARYQALENGPAAVAMLPTLSEMQDASEVRLERGPGSEADEHRVIPLTGERPNTPLLDARNLAELEAAVQRVQPLTAGQASLLSHDFPGWEHAWLQGKGTTIPYESVFWRRQNELTDMQEAWAREVATEHGVVGRN